MRTSRRTMWTTSFAMFVFVAVGALLATIGTVPTATTPTVEPSRALQNDEAASPVCGTEAMSSGQGASGVSDPGTQSCLICNTTAQCSGCCLPEQEVFCRNHRCFCVG